MQSAMETFLVICLVLICSSPIANPAQIGKGSFCIGTGHTKGCDNELTNLHCYEGRCQCPEALTMSSVSLPSNLNTRWYEPLSKCYATRGSLCDLHPTKKRVDCLPGVKCVPDPNNPVAGTCSASTFQLITVVCYSISLLLPFLF